MCGDTYHNKWQNFWRNSTFPKTVWESWKPVYHGHSITSPEPGGRLRKRIANSDWRTDMTDWRTDRLTYWPMDERRVQYLGEYVLQCKKGPLNIQGKLLKKIISGTRGKFWTIWQCSNILEFKEEEKSCIPTEKGGIKFLISFLERGEILYKLQCSFFLLHKFKLRIL